MALLSPDFACESDAASAGVSRAVHLRLKHCDCCGRSPIAEPTESDVRLQLRRILASRFFCNSERLRRFMNFAVNHALFGEGQHLKEVVLGVQVFDRGSTYNSRMDPIVRVEARRLRSKLDSYYTSDGRDDRLLIEFHKRTYTPLFRFRTTRQDESGPTDGSAVAVLPFANLTGSAPDGNFSDGLTEELVHQLIQIPSLQIVFGNPGLQTNRHDESLACRSDSPKWRVRGSIRSQHSVRRVVVQLIDTTSGMYIWSETYDSAVEDVLTVQEGIAQAVVAKLKLNPGLGKRTSPNGSAATMA